MKKLNVILIASGHFPSGTGEAEIEALYNSEIKPLIQAIDKFPRIKMAFHYSGNILHWIERRHPELFMLLEDILARKQVEFLGGGFYNPKLPLLKLSDKIGQIEMLTTYLRKLFGKRPQGCWLPAMAWEQNLVGPLNSCGMNYTFLEDLQFSGAGIKPLASGVYSPCITEDQGKLITVFPLAKEISEDLWKENPSKTLKRLQEKMDAEGNSAAVFPLHGKTGENAGTGTEYEKLLGELASSDPLIDFAFPAEIYKNLTDVRKNYFPGVRASGQDDKNPNNTRQFLSIHPEAGGIYAKTMYVHTLISNKLRGDKTRKKTAVEELWKAQDSCLFTLGSAQIPGLVHSPVRKAAYHALLEAEKITREKGKFGPSLSLFDYDLDGEDEYLFQDDKINCFINQRGAGVFELDYLPNSWNYLDTMNSEGGQRRCAFVDWLAPARPIVAEINHNGIPEGRFCGTDKYEAVDMDRVRRRLTLKLPAKPELPWGDIEIEKTLQVKKNSLVLEYALKNTGKKSERFTFCPSVDLSFPGGEDRYLRIFVQRDGNSVSGGKEPLIPSGGSAAQNVKTLEFQDIKNETVIIIESSRGFEGRIFNVHSDLSGLKEYESTCLMPLYSVSIESGKSWKAAITLKINS